MQSTDRGGGTWSKSTILPLFDYNKSPLPSSHEELKTFCVEFRF